MYYTSLDFFFNEFDRMARKMAADCSSKESFEKWQKEAKVKFREILKLDRIAECDMKPEIVEETYIEGDILKQKVNIYVHEGVVMPMYILIPKGCKDNPNATCTIAMSGHQGGGMMSVVGDRKIVKVSEAIDKFNYDYGLELAKRGIVAVCPETRGFGERRELKAQGDENILACSCYNLSRIAMSLGYSLIGLQVYDVIKLVDYLFERNEWNMSDLRILGFSGGGLQALYSSVVDERIKKVVISGYMYGFKQSLLERNGNCSCNYTEDLWQNFDMGDIGAMVAPRKFVIQNGAKDHLNGADGLENVYSQTSVIKSAYDVLGVPGNVIHDVHEGPHMWCKEKLDNYLEFMED